MLQAIFVHCLQTPPVGSDLLLLPTVVRSGWGTHHAGDWIFPPKVTGWLWDWLTPKASGNILKPLIDKMVISGSARPKGGGLTG